MRKDLILLGVIVATLALMVVPLSQSVIDFLLTINISLSVLLVVVSLYLKHPSDFSTFPSVILIGTAFRLALSVGTTRLILSEADAGQIIETFGDFVVRGSVVIGLVVFLIITVVQFLVVTKGAERVAEVAARFALDALPGKQMSIDAEMRSGDITAEEATLRRRRLDRDSQFFGAMDGAMKFIKGDAIAGLIIIFINLLGGISVGMSVHGYSFGEAVGVFSLLTIGDGLVAQIPALLMALCAGIVVTRVASGETSDLGTDIFKELVSDPRVPTIAAFIVLGIGLIPGFPILFFFGLSFTLLLAALLLRRRLLKDENDAELAAEGDPHIAADGAGDAASAAVATDGANLPVSTRFRLVLGRDVASSINMDVLEASIAEHFGKLYAARGVRFPRADCVTSSLIAKDEIIIELDEVPVFRDHVPRGCLIVADLDAEESLRAGQTRFKTLSWSSLAGFWLPQAQASKLRQLNITPITTEKALAHLTYRLYEYNLGALFSHSLYTELMNSFVAEESETTELVRQDMTEAALFKMFRYLIEDGVPLRPASLLMASLHYWIHSAEDPNSVVLAECLRGSMKRQLCHRLAGPEGILGVVMVDPDIEDRARRGLADFRPSTGDVSNEGLSFADDVSEVIIRQFREIWETQSLGTRSVAIVISADLRRRLRNYLAARDMHFSVLAPHEISNEFTTQPVDLITLENTAQAA